MNRKQRNRSGIFLLELMIAILFFSMASAVCIRLFVKSHTVSEDTRNLNMALNQVSAAAEVFRLGADMQEFLAGEFPYYEEGKEALTFYVYYNEAWENCREEAASFYLSVEIQQQGTDALGCFSMKHIVTEQEIYGLELETYTGEAMK